MFFYFTDERGISAKTPPALFLAAYWADINDNSVVILKPDEVLLGSVQQELFPLFDVLQDGSWKMKAILEVWTKSEDENKSKVFGHFTSNIIAIEVVEKQQPLTVTRVVDGDTLQLSNGEKVRLIGIDCEENEYDPSEAAYLDRGKKWERGPDSLKRAKASAEFTRKLVQGKQVRLEYDVQRKDKYGRTLAYLFIPLMPSSRWAVSGDTGFFPSKYVVDCPSDGGYVCDLINASIVKNGYAKVMTPPDGAAGQVVSNPPNVKYAELFVKLEREAREQKRGLWE